MQIGRPSTGIGKECNTIFSWGLTIFNLNLVTMLYMNTRISSRAYSFPQHILGPPPNGTKVYGAGPFPSNLVGSNFSGSGKHSGSLCVVYDDQHAYKKTK